MLLGAFGSLLYCGIPGPEKGGTFNLPQQPCLFAGCASLEAAGAVPTRTNCIESSTETIETSIWGDLAELGGAGQPRRTAAASPTRHLLGATALRWCFLQVCSRFAPVCSYLMQRESRCLACNKHTISVHMFAWRQLNCSCRVDKSCIHAPHPSCPAALALLCPAETCAW